MSHGVPADRVYIRHISLEDDATYPTMNVGALQVEGITGLTIAGTIVEDSEDATLELFFVNDDGRNICLFSTVPESDLDTQVDILVNAFLPELERILTTAAHGAHVELDDEARVALNCLATKASEYLPAIFRNHQWGSGRSGTASARVHSLETDPHAAAPLGYSASRNESDGVWTWTQDAGVIPLDHTMGVGELTEVLGLA